VFLRCDPAQFFPGNRVVKICRTKRSRRQDFAPDEFFNHVEVVKGNLSDQQIGQRHALYEFGQQLRDTAEIDQVLGQAAPPVDAHGGRKSRFLVETVIVVQHAKGFHERCAACDVIDRKHPSGKQTQTRPAQPADKELRQNRDPFLQFFIAGASRMQLPERLRPAVIVGQYMGADFMLDGRFNTRFSDPDVSPDQQVTARDHKPRHVVANPDRCGEIGHPDSTAGFDVTREIAETAAMCGGRSFATDDSLGIGGLLFDACRVAQMTVGNHFESHALGEELLRSSKFGLDAFLQNNPLNAPVDSRLAFRELGLSIGLRAVEKIQDVVGNNRSLFDDSLFHQVEILLEYVPLSGVIENFWRDPAHQQSTGWRAHRYINMVMLATSLAPDEFLSL